MEKGSETTGIGSSGGHSRSDWESAAWPPVRVARPTLSLACGWGERRGCRRVREPSCRIRPRGQVCPPKQPAPKSRVKAGPPQAPRASAHIGGSTCRMFLELSDTSTPHTTSFLEAGAHFTIPADTPTPRRR